MSQVTKVIDGGLVATLHLPREGGRHPGGDRASGSGGGIATANMFGEPLAASGFVTMCLAYLAMDGLPRNFSQIPLEYSRRPSAGCARIRLWTQRVLPCSACREAARRRSLSRRLFRRSRPSLPVFPAMSCGRGRIPIQSIKTSSFTRAGVELPYASLVVDRGGTTWREWFDVSLRTVPPEAEIPVERINGPVLFVSGTLDGVWPCSEMADAAIDRLRRHRFAFPVDHALPGCRPRDPDTAVSRRAN